MSASDTRLTANLTERTDPASIHPQVQALLREFERRFRELRGMVRRTVGYENDALHLKQGPTRGIHGTGRFDDTPEARENFPASESAAKAAFAAWFLNAARQTILDPLPEAEVRQGAHWTAPFVNQAFVTGIQQARGQLMQAGVSVGERLEPQDILTDGGFERALRTRYWAAFSELEGITDDMATEMDSVLAQAFDEGWSPRKAADRMTTRIGRVNPDGSATMYAARAKALSRTELGFASSEATLERYRRAGVSTVGHVGRIITPDDDVCDWCLALADETFTLDEFAGTRARWLGQGYFVGVPAHPNCRCAPVPRPGVDPGDLGPIEDRLPPTATVVRSGFDMYQRRVPSGV